MVVLNVQGNQSLARLESNREQDIVLGNDKYVRRQEVTTSHGESTELTRLSCKDIQDPGKDLFTSFGLWDFVHIDGEVHQDSVYWGCWPEREGIDEKDILGKYFESKTALETDNTYDETYDIAVFTKR